jgi:hypothetical protein
MEIPKGLRKPHRIAELVPVLLAFLGAAAAAFFAFLHIAQTSVATSNPATDGASSRTDVASSMFQPEVLYGAGALVLLLGLAWGVWRYNRRDRANDPVTEMATREEYQRPDQTGAERSEFERRISPP